MTLPTGQIQKQDQKPSLVGLPPKQSQIARLVTMGLSNKEVANQMFIKECTVKQALTSIYKKLMVKNRAQLIVKLLPVVTEEVQSEKI